MDCDKLISCVQERSALWDHKHKAYYNRDIVKGLWMEIAMEMGTTCELVKNKWRGLRDTFRKDLQKQRNKLTVGPDSNDWRPSWAYFDQMAFVKEQFVCRPPKGNACFYFGEPRDYEDGENDAGALNPDEGAAMLDFHKSSDPQREDHEAAPELMDPAAQHLKNARNGLDKATPAKRAKKDPQDSADERRRANGPPKTEDADYLFLLSLLPFLKNVKQERKMMVRMKLQQVFCDEEELAQKVAENVVACFQSS